MSISINSNSTNPLRSQSYNGLTSTKSKSNQSTEDSEALKEVDDLRKKMLELENELLQIQSSSSNDSSSVSDETKEELEKQLEKVTQALKVAESQATSSSSTSSVSSSQPRFDQYVKGTDDSESPGIYSVKNNESGYSVSFKPYSEGKNEEASVADAHDEGERVQKCTVNTDKVDNEIKQLKQEKENIQTQINNAKASGKSDEEIAQLRQQLTTVESELTSKDNDTYRKQNATFTYE